MITRRTFFLTTGNVNNTGCIYLLKKKIEIWHSLLRAHTQSHDDAATIEKVAKTVRSSAFLASFWGAFVPGYTRGDSRFDFWLIAGKSAEFILQMFSEIAKNTGRAHVVSISKKGMKEYNKLNKILITSTVKLCSSMKRISQTGLHKSTEL